jgi:hypothetical protein
VGVVDDHEGHSSIPDVLGQDGELMGGSASRTQPSADTTTVRARVRYLLVGSTSSPFGFPGPGRSGKDPRGHRPLRGEVTRFGRLRHQRSRVLASGQTGLWVVPRELLRGVLVDESLAQEPIDGATLGSDVRETGLPPPRPTRETIDHQPVSPFRPPGATPA